MYVCIYVCMYACMYVCMYVCNGFTIEIYRFMHTPLACAAHSAITIELEIEVAQQKNERQQDSGIRSDLHVSSRTIYFTR